MKECRAKKWPSCVKAGVLYQTGLGMTNDFSQVARLYRRSFKSGELSGCTNLGSLYRRGKGVGWDPNLTFKSFKKACDGQEERACAYLEE
ncbi:MAG: hypothetical protein VYA34_14635 [Myxococcota bacterium]|nr:hypothetical protein [Myxococcota bacterium]